MTSDLAAPEPPAYFDGQRLTAADLAGAQAFHRELRWLHNRALHPSGIVEGLPVDGALGDVEVRVGRGLALDGRGRELLLTAPQTVPVPPTVAGAPGKPARLLLAMRYDEEPAAAESRAGVCGTSGAVRLAERPLLRFRAPGDVDPAIDVVLAGIEVLDCKLAGPPSRDERREVVKIAYPRLAAGRTTAGATVWRQFTAGGAFAGVETTVDTSSGGFGAVPVYQASVSGSRGSQLVADGPVVIADATPVSFVARMFLPGPVGIPPAIQVNPAGVRLSSFITIIEKQLQWHVAWLGVEL